MREIKFRGKRIFGEEWIYGDLTGDDTIHIQAPWVDDDGSYEWWGIEVIPETVGQFTGLLDKNGVEIYEGDILRENMHGGTMNVSFKCGSFETDHHYGGRLLIFEDLKDTEIIGTIHDKEKKQ